MLDGYADHHTAGKHAAAVAQLVKQECERERESEENVITDLIANLLHLAKWMELDPDLIHERAHYHWWAETDQPELEQAV